ATTFTWVITNAPTVVSINRANPTPTSAATVDFTVTFSQSVSGVDATDFTTAVSGLGGSPAVTAVSSGPASVYTVTVSTGTGDGTLGLNLVDDDTITNGSEPLGGTGTGNGNFTGQVYAVDHTAPTAPTITSHPTDPTNLSSASFSFTGPVDA